MASGLFDEYPKLRVILGHLGEGLPFAIWVLRENLADTAILAGLAF